MQNIATKKEEVSGNANVSETVLTHDEIKGKAFGEIGTCGFGEMKFTHRHSDFTRTK